MRVLACLCGAKSGANGSDGCGFQLRATGIVRNMAAKPDNRETLQAFPGMIPVLERLADACAHDETQQRAAKALKLIIQPPHADAPCDVRRASAPNRGGELQNGAVAVPSNSRGSSPAVSASVSACSSPGRAQARSASPPPSPERGSGLHKREGGTRDGGERAMHSEHAGSAGESEVLRGVRRALMTTRRDSASPIVRLPVNSFSRRASPTGRDTEPGGNRLKSPRERVPARRTSSTVSY